MVRKYFSKNPLVGVFSVVKVEIFVFFLIFSRDRNIFCEIRFNFCLLTFKISRVRVLDNSGVMGRDFCNGMRPRQSYQKYIFCFWI